MSFRQGNETQGVLQSIAKNTSFLTFARLAAKFFSVVFVALLARAIGPAGVGKYTYTGALVAVFLVLPGFGFDLLLVREVAKSRTNRDDFIGTMYSLKLIALAISSGFLLAFGRLRNYDSQTMQLTLLLLGSMGAQTLMESFNAVFQANERMEFQAFIAFLNNTLRVVLGIVAIRHGYSLTGIVAFLLVADLTTLSIAAFVVTKFAPLRPKFHVHEVMAILRAVVPFGVLSLVDIVWLNTDSLLIGRMVGERAVGWYSAANRILVFALLIPNMFTNAIFPVLSRLHGTEPGILRTTYSKSFSFMLSLAFPVAIGGFLLADKIVYLVYGPQFVNTIGIFQVMVWVTTFSFVGFVNGATLNAIGREKFFAVTYSAATLANVGLDYVGIKAFGYIGACYATLILTCIGFLIYSGTCHRSLNVRPDWTIILRSLFAAGIMGVVVEVAKLLSLNVLIILPIGAAVYAILAIVLGIVPRELTKKVVEIVRRRA